MKIHENAGSGINTVLIASDAMLRRTFVSAVVHDCITGVRKINGRLIRFSPVDRKFEMTDGKTKIMESFKALHDLDYFMTYDAFRGKKQEYGENSISFEIRSADEYCGRLEFLNITDSTLESIDSVPMCGTLGAVVLTDAVRIMDGDPSDTGYFMEALGRATERTDRLNVFFAAGRAEQWVKETGKEPDTLSEEAERVYGRLIEYIRLKGFRLKSFVYSASNIDYSKTFDERGRLLENPQFEPYGTERLLREIMLTCGADNLEMINENLRVSTDTLKRRIGRFGGSGARAALELKAARRTIARMMTEVYPAVNLMEYFGKDLT